MSKFSLFFGAATALITPFEQNGELDLKSWQKLLRFQLDGGIDALLVCGTTGEAPTLSDDEATLLLREAVKTAGKSKVTKPVCPATAVTVTVEPMVT